MKNLKGSTVDYSKLPYDVKALLCWPQMIWFQVSSCFHPYATLAGSTHRHLSSTKAPIGAGNPAQQCKRCRIMSFLKSAFDLLFGICGRLRVFVPALRDFAPVLRVKVVVDFWRKLKISSTHTESGVLRHVNLRNVLDGQNLSRTISTWRVGDDATMNTKAYNSFRHSSCNQVTYFCISSFIWSIAHCHSLGMHSFSFSYKYKKNRWQFSIGPNIIIG